MGTLVLFALVPVRKVSGALIRQAKIPAWAARAEQGASPCSGPPGFLGSPRLDLAAGLCLS